MGSEIIAIEEPIVRVLKFMDGNNKPGDFMVFNNILIVILLVYFLGEKIKTSIREKLYVNIYLLFCEL
jgi:hypothetical protein